MQREQRIRELAGRRHIVAYHTHDQALVDLLHDMLRDTLGELDAARVELAAATDERDRALARLETSFYQRAERAAGGQVAL